MLHSAASLASSDSGRGDSLGFYGKEVQQAAGLLADTLTVPADLAFTRLRAYAFLTRRLHLDDHTT
ncbi:hypothetical protein CFP71_18910 [Amycolatopsis thailandensis]|uniref:Uncharacterized protein n=1 Tax=Amycolatopsis thailandensis TaxID=589330 RepID=A0A229S784_9PSEU|nr:hypothetical protein [Amycolatopsis thailandensis]OXM54793.1 hypothetical protein CFP71_18910 [Amycolatopsis thailandensis]